MQRKRATIIPKIGRFDNIDSTVIINTVSKVVQNYSKAVFALLTLFMMTAESIASKGPVLRIIVAIFPL